MSHLLRTAARPAVGAAFLAVLAWRVGTASFLDGARSVAPSTLAAALLIGALTTACCAWRWRLVARGLGVALPWRTAFSAYYGSQFLNTTLPGGVLGDVRRGVRHGRAAGDVARGLRAVAWERVAGQVVQVGIAVAVLTLLPSPVQGSMRLAAAGTLVALALVVAVARWSGRAQAGHQGRWRSSLRVAASEVRRGLLARAAWPGIVTASATAVLGHLAVFWIAVRATGLVVSPVRVLPLALLCLLAMSVPLNLAGWGPREGVAAWAFGAAGLRPEQGVAASVGYGVMVLVATLPGAAVLLLAWRRRRVGEQRHG